MEVTNQNITFSNTTVIKIIISANVPIITNTNNTIEKYFILPNPVISFNPEIIDSVYESGIDQLNSLLMDIPYKPTENSEDGPTWESMSFKWKDGTKYIKRGQKELQYWKRALQRAKKSLLFVRKIISAIKKFLDFYENALKMFLNEIINQIQRMLQDLKSTGFYFLDMTTYHFMDNEDDPFLTNNYIGPWWLNPEAAMQIKKESIFDGKFLKTLENKDATFKDIANNSPFTIGSDGITTKQGTEFSNYFRELLAYKKESYNEFIEKICGHFLDPTDILPRQIVKLQGKQTLFHKDQKQQQDQNKARMKKYSPWALIGQGANGGLTNLKTGRPDFGDNGELYIYIFAVAFPDISQMMEFIYILCGYQKQKDGKFVSKGNGGLLGKVLFDLMNIVKSTVEVFNSAIDTAKDPFDISTKSTLTAQDGRYEWPYWIGLTAGNLFGFMFDIIDEFLESIKNFSYETNRTILDEIDDTLKQIIDGINTLIKIIEIIDQILNFINMLLNIPTMAMLKLHVKPEESDLPGQGGTKKAVKLIRNSKGFFKNSLGSYKEILKIKNEIEKEKLVHDYQDEFTYSDSNTTIYLKTKKYINEYYFLSEARYNLIKNIHSQSILGQLLIKLNGLKTQQNQLIINTDLLISYNNQRQILINTGGSIEDIAAIDVLINLTNNTIEDLNENINELITEINLIFDEFYLLINNSNIWPIDDITNQKIYTISEINLKTWEYEKKEKEIEKINYNNSIKQLISQGELAILGDIKNINIMITNLKIEAEKIYKYNDSNSLLYKYYKMLQSTVDASNKLIKDKLDSEFLKNELENIEIYDPDMKRMFAGFVVVAGKPASLDADKYFDWESSKKNFDFEDEETQKLLRSGWDGISDAGKFIKKIYQSNTGGTG